jgi:hypothetical protein
MLDLLLSFVAYAGYERRGALAGSRRKGDLVVVAREFIRRAVMHRDCESFRTVTVLCEIQ